MAKDAKKKEKKAEAAEQKEADKRAKSMVVIKRIERNKRKFVTSVSGLEAFNLELKKVPNQLPVHPCCCNALPVASTHTPSVDTCADTPSDCTGRQGTWQEICDGSLGDEDTRWWRGNCRPRRLERRD